MHDDVTSIYDVKPNEEEKKDPSLESGIITMTGKVCRTFFLKENASEDKKFEKWRSGVTCCQKQKIRNRNRIFPFCETESIVECSDNRVVSFSGW